MSNQTSYRIRTKLGEEKPINIPLSLMQEFNSFELLSLKLNATDTYNSHKSNEGIVVGRVSTANNGLGIPNVRVSIFVPKGRYNQNDEEKVLYPFSSPTDIDGDRVRYNLLPNSSDVLCYQVVGTLPSKRNILDNETICEVFDKYYKYTTVTNESGDFMLSNIPVGQQRIHIDADLSDIGPFLSQKPYNMIEELGKDKNLFESSSQFKSSKDLDSLVQVISQNKSVYVYPYWGDITENSAEMKVTRIDLSLNYTFKTSAIFIGSVVTDKQSNSIRQNCTPTEKAGKMSELVTGPGSIEMIRKTMDNKIEQHRVKGDKLINDNGVWCYSVPMNLDYVRTDEFGNVIPTDDPKRGVPTRARVRFRITLNDMSSDEGPHKRCSYLVPNNPKVYDKEFLSNNDADYSFGSDTWDESFVDLMWNKVYTVKSFIPRIQKNVSSIVRTHTGIKVINHFGDNNPFPYNDLSIRMTFIYLFVCNLITVFTELIKALNFVIYVINGFIGTLADLFDWGFLKFIARGIRELLIPCVGLTTECGSTGMEINAYAGCDGDGWRYKTKPKCEKDQYNKLKEGGKPGLCLDNAQIFRNCIQNDLAQENQVTSFNFSNDWINGVLYMPLWYRHIKPKKSFLFGLFKISAKNQWCDANAGQSSMKILNYCGHKNSKIVEGQDFNGDSVTYNVGKLSDNCGNKCHKESSYIPLNRGVIVNRETIHGTKAWYYRAVEVVNSGSGANVAVEYSNNEFNPMTSKLLYATDVVLLGSMNDCDSNGIPKFFNYLKSTTYNMPTDLLFDDTEINFKVTDDGELKDMSVKTISVATGCDWSNSNEYGHNDGGLFYGLNCLKREMTMESCVNLRRICEIGVGLDEIKYIENLRTKINSESDKLNTDDLDSYLRPDGVISYDDIIDFNYRSMFATMNGNRLRTKLNEENGVREYDFRHLYIDNFDGSLYEHMKNRQGQSKVANYKNNYNLETTNVDYLTFRYGDRPFFYDGKSLAHSDINRGPSRFTMPKYENSFYFYFGLKEGKTAIDLFNEKYNVPCYSNDELTETIKYEAKPNGWCALDNDENDTFNHKNHDGYLIVDIEKLPLPCTAVLNSLDDSTITYTIIKSKNNTSINSSKFIIYGDGISKKDKGLKVGGKDRYHLKYETAKDNGKPKSDECYMLNNGSYNMVITDGDGNIHSVNIDLRSTYLTFENVQKGFSVSNNFIKNTYRTVGGSGSRSPFNSVAKSPDPSNETINISIDEQGVPHVERIDTVKRYLNNSKDKSSLEPINLNGTICLYNILLGHDQLDRFIIEVEPYDNSVNNDTKSYSDIDFHNNDETSTWYSVKMFNDHTSDNVCKSCTIDVREGKEYVKPTSEQSKYFHFQEVSSGNSTGTIKCYVIKCPKGGVHYRVKVTQVCLDSNGRYYKTNNFVERKIYISEPEPYKLLINDIDYEIIKNFKTGWTLSSGSNLQSGEIVGRDNFKPFKNVGNFNEIKGWLEIGDINKNYNWSAYPDTYGTNDEVFEVDVDGSYKLEKALRIKEAAKPIEPKRYEFDSEEAYNNERSKWAKLDDEWRNGYLSEDGGRDTGSDKWETISPTARLGGACGYTQVLKASEKLINRLNFVTKMREAFWLQDEKREGHVSLTVQTDETPYSTILIYNQEVANSGDDKKHETLSEPSNDSRNFWKCITDTTRDISGIKVPNITSISSVEYGIDSDNFRKDRYPTTYNKTKGLCYAQDNIAQNSKEGFSVSIKPPYIVACVNSMGQTIPNGLPRKETFDKTTGAGLKQFKFGQVGSNKGKIVGNGVEFFQFLFIDKIFSADTICWSYINDIPYYNPWIEYDTTPSDDNKLGYTIKCEGVLAGTVNNGISKQGGYVDDFKEKSAFDNVISLKTFNGLNEDSIPTKRGIFTSGAKSNELVFKNYRFTNEILENNQYVSVPSRDGELDIKDASTSGSISKPLRGNMRVTLKHNTLNDTSIVKEVSKYFGEYINDTIVKVKAVPGEFGEKTLTLRVGTSGSDSDTEIKYYIFKVGETRSGSTVVYPLNNISVITDKVSGVKHYSVDMSNKMNAWDGTSDNALQIFNKNTTETMFGDGGNLNAKGIKSAVTISKGNVGSVEEEKRETNGYGSTGEFSNLSHEPYFVVAIDSNGNRAISPVYDFTEVKYVAGIITNENGNKVLRIALTDVVNSNKKPRNYYLTQYNFTAKYKVFEGTNVKLESDDYPFEKVDLNVKEGNGLTTNDLVGTSYIKDIGGGLFEVHTKTNGSLEVGDETDTKPSGKLLNVWKYAYETNVTVETDGVKQNVVKYVIVEVTDDGNVDDIEKSDTDRGLEVIKNPSYIKFNGNDGSVTYRSVKYIDEDIKKLDYNPKRPYFKKFIDKVLTEDEYIYVNNLLNNGDAMKANFRLYVTDVTGLRHRCLFSGRIRDNGWKIL